MTIRPERMSDECKGCGNERMDNEDSHDGDAVFPRANGTRSETSCARRRLSATIAAISMLICVAISTIGDAISSSRVLSSR